MANANGHDDRPMSAALYARVSTDDQRDRHTIGGQIEALRGFAPHWNMNIVEKYLDDGISGTVPLDKRPAGSRLTEDAKAHKFDVVIFYRLDRLARSLRTFLDIVDFFEEVGIGLRSMTETFDTTNPMGRFAIQMIAAVAELERGTIIERTSMGRARVATMGKWTGGVVPYGYLVDVDGYLTPDWTPRNGCAFSEAEIVQRIFRMIADERNSAMATAKQLNDEGIPMWRKYHRRGQTEAQYKAKPGASWWPTNVTRIIRSETYKGTHVWDAKGRKIEREVPTLVDGEIWERAQRQLDSNKRLSKREEDHLYLLRGLVQCSNCGRMYVGSLNTAKGGDWRRYYYRCGSQLGDKAGRERCDAKVIGTDWLENLVWEDIESFVMNPGGVIDKLQERIETELQAAPSEGRKRELQQAIASKETEKDRLLDAYRRGLIDIDALDAHVQRSRLELEPLQKELASMAAADAERGVNIGKLANAESLLKTLRDTIQGTLDWKTKRQVVEALVWGISVHTTGEGRKKKATVEVTYAFEPIFHAVESGTA